MSLWFGFDTTKLEWWGFGYSTNLSTLAVNILMKCGVASSESTESREQFLDCNIVRVGTSNYALLNF